MSIFSLLKLKEAEYTEGIDHPSTTLLHGRIIQKKPFLKRLYLDFYGLIKNELEGLPAGAEAKIVEIGSGSGFIKEVLPDAITSDTLDLPGVDMNFSALDMPFEDSSVDAYIMIDVFHHLPEPALFLKEAARTLRSGGRIVMIEPAVTAWSRLIYENLHHEDFDPRAGWSFDATGPLSSANIALPWIIFSRDLGEFEEKFPMLRRVSLVNHTPFLYLFSGGVSLKQLAPSFSYGAVKGFETILSPIRNYLSMFMTIRVDKIS
ncbi:MAG: class I SAM-dependent methyltransferase [Thermodesulfobacteriota bacterium]